MRQPCSYDRTHGTLSAALGRNRRPRWHESLHVQEHGAGDLELGAQSLIVPAGRSPGFPSPAPLPVPLELSSARPQSAGAMTTPQKETLGFQAEVRELLKLMIH